MATRLNSLQECPWNSGTPARAIFLAMQDPRQVCPPPAAHVLLHRNLPSVDSMSSMLANVAQDSLGFMRRKLWQRDVAGLGSAFCARQ